MDSFVIFWLFTILIVASIVIGVIFLAYWIPKKSGKRKLGIWLSGILTTGILLLILSSIFQDKFFFKSDAKKCLNEHNIELKDDFKIVSNNTGFLSDNHQFILTISKNDKKRLIDQITSAENYQDSVSDMFDLREGKIRYCDKDTTFTANYQDKWNYIFEFYKPNEQGFVPTWDKISISKEKNELIYNRILD